MCSDGGAAVSTRQSPPAAGHDWAAELLSALLDGELDEKTAAAVTAHVQECAECSRDWAELRATKQLLAALPAARAPRSYAVLADDPGEPGRAGATFWPRLLGLTWRLSGAVAVVIILIGTMQLAGIGLGEEVEIRYVQGLPGPAGPAGRQGERGATGAAGAQGAAGAAGQTIVVEKEKPVVVEKVVEKIVTVEKPVVVEKVVEKVVEVQVAKREVVEKVVVVEAAVAQAPAPIATHTATTAPTATRTATPTASPTATATIPPTATPAPPTVVPTPAPAARTAAPRREPAGPTFAPGVLWLIGGAVVVVVAGVAWLGERWVRGRQG